MDENKYFEFFKKRCLHWSEQFNLKNIEFVFKLEALDNAYASTFFSEIDRMATIVLDKNSDWQEDLLDSTALHEILEVLLSDLRLLAKGEATDSEVENKRKNLMAVKAVHEIINRISSFIKDQKLLVEFKQI